MEQPAGSPSPGEPVFLVVGKLRRPHGLRGEILLDVYTDFPERLRKNTRVYLGEEHRPVSIRSRRVHGRGLLLSFEGYDSPEEVGQLTHELVFVRVEDRPPLPEGEYYHHQLIGLQVVEEGGRVLGALTQILENPANDVYVVQPESGPEILLPAIEPVILDVDLEKGVVLVHLLPGLLDR
jgi:16S rRNA processing protein RimM